MHFFQKNFTGDPAKRTYSAAAYLHESATDKPAAEQREAIEQLAEHESCQIIAWFGDEAPASPLDTRPGLSSLLSAARARRFSVLLAWHTDRFQPAGKVGGTRLASQLRRAGIRLITCAQGPIDLGDFAKDCLVFLSQQQLSASLGAQTVEEVLAKLSSKPPADLLRFLADLLDESLESFPASPEGRRHVAGLLRSTAADA